MIRVLLELSDILMDESDARAMREVDVSKAP